LSSSACCAREFARHAASSAPLVTPMPTWGRATKAASPRSATRPIASRGDSTSKTAWKKGCERSTSVATCGASSRRASSLIAAARKAVLERPVDVGPRAHHVSPWAAIELAAVAVDADALARGDAEALVERDAEPCEHADQLGVRADASAARGEVVHHLLIDVDLPAEVGEQVGGEEATERSADDE